MSEPRPISLNLTAAHAGTEAMEALNDGDWSVESLQDYDGPSHAGERST